MCLCMCSTIFCAYFNAWVKSSEIANRDKKEHTHAVISSCINQMTFLLCSAQLKLLNFFGRENGQIICLTTTWACSIDLHVNVPFAQRFRVYFLLRHVYRTDLKCSFFVANTFHCCSFAPIRFPLCLYAWNSTVSLWCDELQVYFFCVHMWKCERIRTIFDYLICKQHLRFSEERVSEWVSECKSSNFVELCYNNVVCSN